MKLPSLVRMAANTAACSLLMAITTTSSSAQKVVATIPAQEGSFGLPMTIAVNPLTQLVYIAGNGVEVVNQKTNTPITTINVGQNQLSGIAINPVTRRLYVTDLNTGMYVVDLTTNSIVGQFPLPIAWTVTYDSLTNRVYTLDGQDNVWVNDGTTGSLIKEIAVPPQSALGVTITLNPATKALYIPLQSNPGQMLVVNPGTDAVTTVPLQGGTQLRRRGRPAAQHRLRQRSERTNGCAERSHKH